MTLHDARPERASCASCQDQNFDARRVLLRAGLALLLKLALLAALYFVFFAAPHRPALTRPAQLDEVRQNDASRP